jgi:hypothetical protein
MAGRYVVAVPRRGLSSMCLPTDVLEMRRRPAHAAHGRTAHEYICEEMSRCKGGTTELIRAMQQERKPSQKSEAWFGKAQIRRPPRGGLSLSA